MSAKEKISQEAAEQPSKAPSESAPVRVLSSEDNLVADLINEQPTAEQIARMTIVKHRIPDLLAFPEEVLAKHGKEYYFAWLTKDKQLSVRLRTNGWVLCNRTNSPYIKAHRFGTHGAVEQSGMLLAFMPRAMHEEMSKLPGQMSNDRIKHYTKDIFRSKGEDDPIQFYKPEDDDKD